MANHPNIGVYAGGASGHGGWDGPMNATLRLADTLLQLSVKDIANTPPGGPADGDRYIVGAAPTGAFVGHAGKVAVWDGSAWVFYTSKPGWKTFVEDEGSDYVYASATIGWVVDRIAINAKNFASIQAAITAASALASKAKVIVPNGTYAITAGTAITIPSNVILEAESKGGVVLTCADAAVNIVTITGNECGIRGITITGPNSAGAGIGIYVPGSGSVQGQVRIEDCTVQQQANWGIKFGDDSGTNIVIDSFVARTSVSSSATTTAGSVWVTTNCTTIQFEDCNFVANNSAGTFGAGSVAMGAVYVKGCVAINFRSCLFQPPAISPGLSMLNVAAISLLGCYFERSLGGGTMNARSWFITTSGYCYGLSLFGCYVANFNTTAGMRLLKTDSSAAQVNVAIGGGSFNSTTAGSDDFSLGSPSTDRISIMPGTVRVDGKSLTGLGIPFLADSATPSVAGLANFGAAKVSFSTGRTITALGDGYAGQVVILMFIDGNATINDSGNFKLNTAAGNFTSSADDTMVLVCLDGTVWQELARSVN